MEMEIRSDGSLIVEGYVNAVDRFSKVLYGHKGKFIEKVAPTTFTRALENASEVPMLLNHDVRKKIADTKDGTLELFEDNIGLKAKAIITDSEAIQEIRSGQLKGWSFGFKNPKDTWEDGKVNKRTLHDLELTEVSLLTIEPAYIGTSISIRSDEIELRSIEDISVETQNKKEKVIKDFQNQMLDLDIWLMKNR